MVSYKFSRSCQTLHISDSRLLVIRAFFGLGLILWGFLSQGFDFEALVLRAFVPAVLSGESESKVNDQSAKTHEQPSDLTTESDQQIVTQDITEVSAYIEFLYYIMTFCKWNFSAQSPILVNRGWVPRSWKDKSSKHSVDDEQPLAIESPTGGESRSSRWWFQSNKPDLVQVPDVISTKVVGVVRGSENPIVFVPANDPSSSQWFYVDVPAISSACGLPENTIYIEDTNDNVNPSNPYPLPKDPSTLIRSSVMPQDHLNYTFTCRGYLHLVLGNICLYSVSQDFLLTRFSSNHPRMKVLSSRQICVDLTNNINVIMNLEKVDYLMKMQSL
ncbi:hypothetical protein POM88_053981 [Heracleum sosnowskyi]|uniref:SURF1-like protein n=1 Tax=Heracleum sosnowskyi TaxID=360622 RepID=A0AAD8LVA3_9APIA|nr:hypothetical protein POM88_053981 [Heracleum sosnowskyi]